MRQQLCNKVIGVQPAQCNIFFDNLKNKDKNSPEDEIPCRTMPKTCEKPYDQEIENSAGCPFSVAAKRDVHIFTKPGAERNMPSAPEISDTPCHIRMLKVRRHIKAEHFPEPDRHQGISAEVEVELHGIGKGTKPCERSRDTLKTDRTHFIPQSAYAVCDDDFVSETDDKSFETIVKTMDGNRAFFQCIADVGVDDDRACNQLGKHTQIRAKADIGLIRFGPSKIDIDDIGCNLEGIEADSQRQRDVECIESPMDIEQSQRCINIFNKEIRVFKKEQKSKIVDE